MNEEWRPVVGWEGWYAVSSFGRVMRVAKGRGSYPGRILNPKLNHDGYPVVGLQRGDNRKMMRLVHTLVAEAFIGPIPDGMEVNHNDGIKTNNYPDNFEFLTHLDNMRHASMAGLWKDSLKGENATNVRLSERDVRDLRLLHGRIPNGSLCALFDVTPSHLWKIVTRRIWKHVA